MKKPIISTFMALLMAFTQCLLVPAAQAAMVTTQGMVDHQQRQALEQQVMRLLDRDAARQVLAENGVSHEQIQQRVSRLSDQELQKMAHQADTLPAGQGVLGVILAVILILVLLDLLGATNVFPAIHPLGS